MIAHRILRTERVLSIAPPLAAMSGTDTDFNEAQVRAMLARSSCDSVLHRWLSCGNKVFGIRANWVRRRASQTSL